MSEPSEGEHTRDDCGIVPVVQAMERFEAFYARERRQMIGLAVVSSGSARAAEDLAQEAFAAAFRSWDRVAMLDDPGAWVRRVVANGRCR